MKLWLSLALIIFTLAGPAAAPAQVNAVYRAGQVFITWTERADLAGEIYRVYRSAQPINAQTLSQAQRLAELAEGSATFYANRYQSNGVWRYRYLERYVVNDDGPQLPAGSGLFVHTVQADGTGYYAVTITPAGGSETLDPAWSTGPLAETRADPLPVRTSLEPSPGARVYIQYMDAAAWNATFHAPNASNSYYGFSSSDARFAHSLQYAYDYVVVSPRAAACGGSLPALAPVVVVLHGYGFNGYEPYLGDAPAYCAYYIVPYDESETWWFGFARRQDYRTGSQPAAGDVIVNFTEQRLLRMVYDLLRTPGLPAAPDTERVYVYGHSMGGSGALALALRYPQVFAAAYASQPMTNIAASTFDDGFFITDAAVKWGALALNLPVELGSTAGWGSDLRPYNGTGVWDWQNQQLMARLRVADAAPFGVAHGQDDRVVDWQTQAVPFYPALDASRRAWAGAITTDEHHDEKFDLLPPTLGVDAAGVPFAGLQAVKDETIPGLANATYNPPWPAAVAYSYHTGVRWAASWSAWDEPPLDSPQRWEMSFCAVNPAVVGAACGSGASLNVDISPRRLQAFAVLDWHTYLWENRRLSDGALLASGIAQPASGLLILPQVQVLPQGNRVSIFPAAEQPAPVFLPIITR